jgi:triosephosphate isomerase (TIM)
VSRRPYIVGNWKMHKTVEESEAFVQALLPRVAAVDGADFGVCPPFLSLQAVVDSARGSQLTVFAQNMHAADKGAFTGEVSAPMLSEIDVQGVLLGHSERREHFAETDAALREKVRKALDAELVPLLCVGETKDERQRGETEDKLRRQVAEDLADVPADRLADVVIAYEPIWAIGTGDTATPEQAQDAVAFIRGLVRELKASAAEDVRILYGGSVKLDNLGELVTLPDVDGALVGGASLDPADFAEMIDIAQRA